jgi:hypothetical protein
MCNFYGTDMYNQMIDINLYECKTFLESYLFHKNYYIFEFMRPVEGVE